MFVHVNVINFWTGIVWCGLWFFLVLIDFVQLTSAPYLRTLWDAIWIPFIVAVVPFFIGVSVGLKRS